MSFSRSPLQCKIVSNFEFVGCFGARRVHALCLNHHEPHLQLTITQSEFIGSAAFSFHMSCFLVSPAYIQDPMSNFKYQCLTSDIWLQIFNFGDLIQPIEIRSLLLQYRTLQAHLFSSSDFHDRIPRPKFDLLSQPFLADQKYWASWDPVAV